MANVISRKLTIVLKDGYVNGKMRAKRESYSGVSATVSDDDLLRVAQGINGIQQKEAMQYLKIETIALG